MCWVPTAGAQGKSPQTTILRLILFGWFCYYLRRRNQQSTILPNTQGGACLQPITWPCHCLYGGFDFRLTIYWPSDTPLVFGPRFCLKSWLFLNWTGFDVLNHPPTPSLLETSWLNTILAQLSCCPQEGLSAAPILWLRSPALEASEVLINVHLVIRNRDPLNLARGKRRLLKEFGKSLLWDQRTTPTIRLG